MVKLKTTKNIKRKIRCDDRLDLAEPTVNLIKQAIDEGRLTEAQQMTNI